jgi:UDP-N-acetylmuramoyl-L-alanyl-D-glutamate--2,6-diaminopimelate ligase
MRLVELGKGCLAVPARWRDLDVLGLASDSREVKPGYLFVAVTGEKIDGRLFASKAEEAGAVAVIGEKLSGPQGGGGNALDLLKIPFLGVRDSRLALGSMAANFYGRPGNRLALTGVTGTKGKTTTAWILDAILRAAGKTSALLGTVHNRIGNRTYPSANTTPSSLELHRFLRDLCQEGGTHAVLEVSSHGILQRRLAGLDFRCGVFTNVAPEHLDYHRTFQNYVQTKVSFFAELSREAFAVLPRDEPVSSQIAALTKARVAWCGSESQDGVEHLRMGPEGMTWEWKGSPVRSRLWGYHNLLNILAAMTAAECLGFSRSEIAAGIETAVPPPGRLEKVNHAGPFQVFVDYAHTDGSLKTVLEALRAVTPGRLITVFGCGGDRDRAKRPRMGRVAEEGSDHVVVTSDNPRSEDPRQILQDIMSGLKRPEEAVFEVDRKDAIALGIRMARANDTVLIAGKGHETYQEFKDHRVHFDDREVAREFLS